MIHLETVFGRRPFRVEDDTVLGTWISFERTGESDSGITERFAVREGQDGAGSPGRMIAEVRWYAPWRCYAFLPGRLTVYEAKCLREIALFVRILTRTHRALRRAGERARP